MFFDGMRIIRKYARFRKNFNIKKDNFGFTLGKFSKKATIEEKVLYDKDNVKITATNLEYGEEAANLKLKIKITVKRN